MNIFIEYWQSGNRNLLRTSPIVQFSIMCSGDVLYVDNKPFRLENAEKVRKAYQEIKEGLIKSDAGKIVVSFEPLKMKFGAHECIVKYTNN